MTTFKSSSVLIRLAIPEDRKEIIELEKLALKNYCYYQYNTQDLNGLTQNIHPISFDDEIIVVAEINNFIIGFASLLSYRKLLRTLYVKPNFLKQKIGSRLLRAIEKEAVKHQIKTLKATPFPTDKELYTSLGYEEIAFCHLDKMNVLVPCIAMEKQLMPIRYHHLILRNLLATLPNLLFLLLII